MTVKAKISKVSQVACNEDIVIIGHEPVLVGEVIAIALGKKRLKLNDDTTFRQKITDGARFLEEMLKQDGVIYGVTTGYGDSCTNAVPLDLVNELPIHLTRFHGCGMGQILSEEQSIAVMVVRLCSLVQGNSGVSLELLQQIERLIQHRIAPVIPEEGSVGASGDLTPLSYMAAVLIGEREVLFKGQRRPTADVFKELKITPITLRPKEGLAIMNGTAVMTAMACKAYCHAEYLSRICSRMTAMASIVIKGNPAHFDEALFNVKPHPGQMQVAKWIREDLSKQEKPKSLSRLQDRYSIRCAPHIIGVLEDILPWMKKVIEIEINSTNDNPVIADGQVMHGGHFYGGHIAFVMDSLKNCIANLADMMYRQMALLLDTKFNNGLPANLSGAHGARAMINHGFKAVQIGVSAWTAEALKLTMPASVFSRSTECHNQDKVSMGTIAARDCLRVIELTEQVAAALLLVVTQGLDIRIRQGELERKNLSEGIQQLTNRVSGEFSFLEEDTPLENVLRRMVGIIQSREWEVYAETVTP